MCFSITRSGFAILLLIPALAGSGNGQDNRAEVGTSAKSRVIVCEGDYQHHLQGICRDSQGNLFWSFTTTLVKTDRDGHRLKEISVDNHHGDLCFHDEKIFVAVNLGRFNDPEGNADSWVYEYRSNDLSLVAKHETQQVFHGAGGIAFQAGKFLVVGGLPDDVNENYVYEYDRSFNFVAKRTIASGHTHLGIQTAAFANGHWWFGCYGNRLLKVDPQYRLIGNYPFDCGLGIVGSSDGSFRIARGPRTADSRCTGQVLVATEHRQFGLSFQRPITKLLFGSCIKQEKPMPLLKTIIAEKPELFLMLGDNIYADTTDMEVMRTKYAKLRSNEDFTKLLDLCPVLATWDDHDYGVNDGGASYLQRVASQRLFVDFWGDTADSPRRSRPGVYDETIIGPPGKRLQIILLDTRYFRGPLTKGTKRTGGPYLPTDDATIPMLGEPQWKWLEEQLRRPAEIRLIVSSIQCVSTAAGQETWSNLPHERRRLFELLGKTNANGVVIVSGDRHWSELSVEKGLAPYPVYDLTSSSLNQIHSRGTPTDNPNRDISTTFHRENFGAIEIDWEAADPRLTLKIVDIEGSVVFQKALQLSHLRATR
jgi:alkaline phosphatase D